MSPASKKSQQRVGLVGDVGGTNCRLAIVSGLKGAEWSVSRARTYSCGAFAEFSDILESYLEQERIAVSSAVIAVAGPVVDGAVSMTNRDWRISEGQVAKTLGAGDCHVINDFEALAYALPALGEDQLRPLGPRLAPGQGTLVVVGAGTGLGVAALARSTIGETALASEGGHIAFSPRNDVEAKIANHLARDSNGFVSVEHVLSGSGLVRLHRALCAITGGEVRFDTPDAITGAAEAGDADALALADQFARIFGSVAGDIALVFGARGGVFVAGGVSRRILSIVGEAAFRTSFEAKGDFQGYMAGIPTNLIEYSEPGLLGAACALKRILSGKG
jgi:glucokinase